MHGVVDSGQNVGVHVVHGLALQHILGKAHRYFPALAHFLFPGAKDRRCVGRLDSIPKPRKKVQATVSGEPENRLAEIFVELSRAGAAGQFAGVEFGDRF